MFKSTNFLGHQLSHLTTVPQIHVVMATKPPQLIEASFTLTLLVRSIQNPQQEQCSVSTVWNTGETGDMDDILGLRFTKVILVFNLRFFQGKSLLEVKTGIVKQW